MSMNTPILLMAFNRPDTTRQVMDALRKVQPTHLYVAVDGPRANKEGEKALCDEVKKIATTVDWECDVVTLFREQNLGCGHGPANAINWFFTQVEQGIILEDDCVPDPSFFNYCTDLLEYYKDDERIMHISGNNFTNKEIAGKESYYFNYFFTAWGWATWRRAWHKYQFTIPYLDSFLQSGKLQNICMNQQQHDYWTKIFELVRDGNRGDIWDYQWILTCWNNDGLAITPKKNLVTNIGFGADATHTVQESRVSYVKTEALAGLTHPTKVVRNKEVDRRTFINYFEVPQHLNNIRKVLYSLLPQPIMMQIRKIRRKFFPNLK
jgi:GNT-I family